MFDFLRQWTSDAESRAFLKRLAIILAVAFALRLAWSFVIPVIPESDSSIYWRTAQNIVIHGVYGVFPNEPFSYWPVGAPAIYAGAFKLAGVSFAVVVAVNILAGLALVATTALLARRWFGPAAGLLAAAILALWPSLIFYSTILASEVFFAVLINLALLAWRPGRKHWPAYALLAGAALAGAIYTRPVALLLPFLFFVLDCAGRKRVSLPPAAFAAIAVATAAVLIAPWTARNYALHDQFVLISTNGGPVLWMGNNPNSSGDYMQLPERTRGLSEYERSRVLGNEAVAYMIAHPAQTAARIARRAVDTHGRETIAVVWNERAIAAQFGAGAVAPAKILASAYWLAMLAGALAGCVLLAAAAYKERTWLSRTLGLMHPAILMWAYYAGMHAVILSGDRYHFPSIPFIAALAAFALSRVADAHPGARRVLWPYGAPGAPHA